jgi:phage FluMu protein gp41
VAAKPVSPEIARLTKQELASLKAMPMVWDDLMAKLRATDPGLFVA